MSPDGQYVATLANDYRDGSYEFEPTFRIWEFFEKIQDDHQLDLSTQEICHANADYEEKKLADKERLMETERKRRSNSRKKLER